MMLAGEPQRAHRFLDALMKVHVRNLERFLSAVGTSIDVILLSDHLGARNSPQISPRMYREFFKPRHAAMWAHVKKLADVKVMLHRCGIVRPLLPDLIDAGLDIINPVQINCRGMEAERLKRDFGKDLVFWGGGCDTQHVFPLGTPAEVRKHVLHQCEVLALGGGFVFHTAHNVQGNVAVENLIAMYDALHEYDAPQGRLNELTIMLQCLRLGSMRKRPAAEGSVVPYLADMRCEMRARSMRSDIEKKPLALLQRCTFGWRIREIE